MTASETGSAAASPASAAHLLEGGPSVSLIVAAAIVVADMVGVGVFTSLGYQVQDIPSGFSLLLLWIVGGVVALCGVAAYSELADFMDRQTPDTLAAYQRGDFPHAALPAQGSAAVRAPSIH